MVLMSLMYVHLCQIAIRMERSPTNILIVLTWQLIKLRFLNVLIIWMVLGISDFSYSYSLDKGIV